MKLIKLNNNHYIIVEDSEIKQGDWIYNPERQPSILECVGKGSLRDWKKVTHSTQPLETVPLYKMPNGELINEIWHDKIKQLSLSEVKELLCMSMDLIKRKDAYLQKVREEVKDYPQHDRIYILGSSDLAFTEGYNQALEDNKDRKYTGEDIKTAFSRYAFASTSNQPYSEDELLNEFRKFIQSIQPKTEWDVKFDDRGKLKLV